jgi:hypothetical protein
VNWGPRIALGVAVMSVLVTVMPPVGPHLMSVVIEAVARPPNNGQADLADLARLPALGPKDLF